MCICSSPSTIKKVGRMLISECSNAQGEAREEARVARADARQARQAQASEQARAERLHARLCQLDPDFEDGAATPNGSTDEVGRGSTSLPPEFEEGRQRHVGADNHRNALADAGAQTQTV